MKTIIAINRENDTIIKGNLESFKIIFGENIPVKLHPKIRSAEAYYDAFTRAVALAKSTVQDFMSSTSALQRNCSCLTIQFRWSKRR